MATNTDMPIVVTEADICEATTLRNINNFSQIFSQLALGAAAIAVVK
jgi:hypothetical protein